MDKQQFLKGMAVKRGAVEVDGIGTVHFREFTAREAAHFEVMATDTVDTINRKLKNSDQLFELQLYTLITCMIDENGGQFWETGDGSLLQDIPKSVIEKISDAILELSGMSKKKALPASTNGSTR